MLDVVHALRGILRPSLESFHRILSEQNGKVLALAWFVTVFGMYIAHGTRAKPAHSGAKNGASQNGAAKNEVSKNGAAKNGIANKGGTKGTTETQGGSSEDKFLMANVFPCQPVGTVLESNASEAASFDTGSVHGKYLFLHRPTTDKQRFASGDYPYGEHMHGRQRLWEMRVQMTVREELEGDIYFGVEADRYQKPAAWERFLVGRLLGMIQYAVGGVSHSFGDDPKETEGEIERNRTVFPLWVVDQLIVTRTGEQPPCLSDPNFSEMGLTKAEDRVGFSAAINELQFKPGITITIGVWGAARFADAIRWRYLSPIGEGDFRDIGTHSPGYLVIYSLLPKNRWDSVKDDRDMRHLDSRRKFLMRICMWSSLIPTTPKHIQELVYAGSAQPESKSNGHVDKQQQWQQAGCFAGWSCLGGASKARAA